ncbi:large ribosomal subunit protein uL13m [Hydra vulgaris]|uniref:large ribosomal subunit protein uL13m n=1 Tax=Hydra vulgaris TaxID=6087 RepID=UPI001F5F3816|nr:39S ribosomal protein L13, mitochondrial-like [Hydra vulgaris]
MSFIVRSSQSFLTNARVWYLIDARDQMNGKLAGYIAQILLGKHKPIYHPCSDLGDHVVVTNCKHIYMKGHRVWESKIYRHHTGYPGGLKEIQAKEVFKNDPCQILWRAVRGMMPKTRSRNLQMKRLHLFEDDQHPFAINIYAKLKAPHPMPRRLDEYTADEVKNYPRLF